MTHQNQAASSQSEDVSGANPPLADPALTALVPAARRRRKPRAEAAAVNASALREAIDNLRHTVRFLEELLVSRRDEVERAIARASAELDDLRLRIRSIEELGRQERV